MSWRGRYEAWVAWAAGLSLRARMAALLVAASLLPLALSAAVDVRQTRARLLENSEILLRSGAERIVREVDEYNRARLNAVERIARYPQTAAFCNGSADDRAAAGPAFRGMLATFPPSDDSIGGVALLDHEGRVLAAANPALAGVDLSFRPHVRRALRGLATMSDVYLTVAQSGAYPAIGFAAPVPGPDGGVACVAVLAVKAATVWDRMRAGDGAAGPGSFAVLFDREGIRIGHSYNDDIVFHPGGRLAAETVDRMVAERRFGDRTRALLEDVRDFPAQFERARATAPDTRLFLGFAPVNSAMNYGVARRFATVPWTLFYMVPEANVDALLMQRTWGELGIAAAIIAGALLAGLVFTRSLVRPVGALGVAAQAVADGDLSARVRPGGGAELSRLALTFNGMAEQLQAQAHAAERAHEELEHRVGERTREVSAVAERLRGEILEREGAELRLQAQLERLALLDQITCAIGERQDLQSIYQVVVRSLEERLPVDFCCICRYDAAGDVLTVTRVGIHSAVLAAELAMPENAAVAMDGNGLARCVRGHLVHEPDLAALDFPFPQRLRRGGLGSLVAAPLQFESRIFGVLLAARRAAHGFSSGECEFLRQLSAHVALAARQAELIQSLQDAYDDLRQTQQAVMQQERLRALGQMASGIAHDINNAISPISLYAETLLEREHALSARGREQLRTIAMAIDDVAATVARLREFYRPREGPSDLRPVRIDLLLRQVAELTRARWHDMPQQRGVVVALEYDLAPDLPAVPGVETELREAFINLVFNAVDAMPSGGRLRLRAGQSAPGTVSVEVTDTGLGMDEATRRRCLEPFFTTKGARGTGLGLAMVYGVAQRHGAEIEIESAPGAGTTVRLVFPSAGPAAAPAATDAAPLAAPVPVMRILVVDDDPLILRTLEETLSADGHAVATASGGQAGIDAMAAARRAGSAFDLVITDLGMPYVDGRRVAAAAKAVPPEVPVVMLTGWGQRLVADGSVPEHVDVILAKPPKIQALRAALRQVARGRVEHDEEDVR